MSQPMYRAQILLEPDQRKKLQEIARREGKSISAVTRQVIDAGLEAIENESELWERRARVLRKLKVMREKQETIYPGNLVEEARQEREDEMDRIWRGE